MVWVVSSLLQNSFIIGASSREVNQTEIFFFPADFTKKALQFVRLEVQHRVTPFVKRMARGLWWKEITQYGREDREEREIWWPPLSGTDPGPI